MSNSTQGDLHELRHTHTGQLQAYFTRHNFLLDGFIRPASRTPLSLSSIASVTDDDEQPDGRDDDGRRHPESEVAPEGEVVPEELGSPRLLADNQVRRRTQEGEVPSHGADPC